METGIELIAQERKEQIEKHGFDIYNDVQSYSKGELKQAAKYCLTLNRDDYPKGWSVWFINKVIEKQNRLSKEDFEIEMLKIAGSFCSAEIDRIKDLIE